MFLETLKMLQRTTYHKELIFIRNYAEIKMSKTYKTEKNVVLLYVFLTVKLILF